MRNGQMCIAVELNKKAPSENWNMDVCLKGKTEDGRKFYSAGECF
jgi:hypothetical protein